MTTVAKVKPKPDEITIHGLALIVGAEREAAEAAWHGPDAGMVAKLGKTILVTGSPPPKKNVIEGLKVPPSATLAQMKAMLDMKMTELTGDRDDVQAEFNEIPFSVALKKGGNLDQQNLKAIKRS